MLTAHANTTSEDFIAQLRTHVIAFGCSQMVVDCVDNLAGIDDAEDRHAEDIRAAEDKAERETKNEIAAYIERRLNTNPNLSGREVLDLLMEFEF